ncbi:hypothetical protein F5883DRAFT_722614 [Diaporthe sp. PMI_573]|nr:hypothetical protein F5883DRAFT_722614 [Diaporthaceae sp. PMI_573]
MRREDLKRREAALGFEWNYASRASHKEQHVNRILQGFKAHDEKNVYSKEPARQGVTGQSHPRVAGDHFLANKALIDRTMVFKLARQAPKGAHLHIHFNACLQPHVLLQIANPTASKGNLFQADYVGRRPMTFREFIQEFPQRFHGADALGWLKEKLVFREEEAHDPAQTVKGAWEEFNARTQMMKGLFNYETAYHTNQVWTDDRKGKIDNIGIMEIIIQEVASGLAECLRFKKRWPSWIAGFDLVGEEGMGKPLSAFVPELLQFRKDCAQAGVGEIPFLFHCGETLESGSETDDNLVDAVLLGTRRIGHGFSLARRPYLMERMKKAGVCVELCPISNEVLGLTPRVSGHAMYGMLANNVHCTVSSDNGTLFNSTLSHDFYQAMIGRPDMTLFGWKQLIEWSIEHACMSPVEQQDVRRVWNARWERFLDGVIEEFGAANVTFITLQSLDREDAHSRNAQRQAVERDQQLAEGLTIGASSCARKRRSGPTSSAPAALVGMPSSSRQPAKRQRKGGRQTVNQLPSIDVAADDVADVDDSGDGDRGEETQGTIVCGDTDDCRIDLSSNGLSD